MTDARATLHDTVVSAGMTVIGAMLAEERAKLCGRGRTSSPYARTSAVHVEEERLQLPASQVPVEPTCWGKYLRRSPEYWPPAVSRRRHQ